MSARSKRGWCQLPLEPALQWFKLSLFARALGAELFRVYQDTVIELDLGDAEDVLVRMLVPEQPERKATRRALRAMIETGLLVTVAGGIRLLYSREAYASHHAPKVAEGTAKVPVPYVNGAPTMPQPHADGTPTVPAKPAESLEPNPQIDREKERERERENARAEEGAERFTRTRALVRQEFAQRYAAKKPKSGMWTKHSHPDVDRFTRWLLTVPGDLAENLRRTLDTFFADEYAAGIAFGIGHLANEAAKYLEPPSGPVGSVRRTSKQARAEAQAAMLAHDDAGMKRLMAEVKELEAAEERAARGYRARA